MNTTARRAVARIKSGDRVFVHGGSAVPLQLLAALFSRSDELDDVVLIHLHLNGFAASDDHQLARHIRHRAIFVDGGTRTAVAAAAASYLPVFLSDVPRLFETRRVPLDAALLHLSPPDAHGFCSLGVSVDCALAAARAARLRIAQINPQMPRTHGDASIHVDELDEVVNVDSPLPEPPVVAPTATHRAIGRQIAELIDDGATLQLGIGAIPNAVAAELGDRRHLGIHSEVVSDGVIELIQRGVITGARKTIDRGKLVTAFLSGSRRLHALAEDNPLFSMRGVDYTNDTRIILQLDNMVAINGALEVDLTGQVGAESVGGRMHSGVGGQLDFIRGAALARGGRPIIALPATARHGTVSRIVPTLGIGAGVTTTRAHVHWVVTEHGRVDLHGLDIHERARALIGLADPGFREQLTREALRLGTIPT